MKTIDLHGVRHSDVESLIIEACASSSFPLVVITGNSDIMKRLVAQAASIMGLYTRDSISNPGRVVIDEGR